MEPALEEIARRHGVRLILQFGSTVTGKTHARSDVDLAVLLERPRPSMREQAELVGELQRAFPGREVDLTVVNSADPLLLKKITEDARLLYGSRRDLQELRIYAFKRYQDHRRYLEMERRFVTGRFARTPTG